MIATDLSSKNSRSSRLSSESPDRDRKITFNIHGIVGVRLINPSPQDTAMVARKLGPPRGRLLHEPDITIRFVEHLPATGLKHLGFGQAFTEEAFFLFERGTNSPKAKMPFDQLGGPCEIVCESGIRSVPLLMPILGLTALAKGCAAIHASAFAYNGAGVLMAGWAESGKTTALLGYLSRAAEFVGEEWVLLSRDGQMVYGLPAEIEISPLHLATLPHLRHAIPFRRRWLVGGLRLLEKMQWRFLGKRRERSLVWETVQRLTAALEERTIAVLSPEVLSRSPIGSLAATPEKVFLMVKQDDPLIRVEATPHTEMVNRLTYLAQHELSQLMEHYRAFKFAFPGRRNAFVEQADTYQRVILSRALLKTKTYTVRHGHPWVFAELYEKLSPFLGANGAGRNETRCSPTSALSCGGQMPCEL
jgi:hypothetical protein